VPRHTRAAIREPFNPQFKPFRHVLFLIIRQIFIITQSVVFCPRKILLA